MKDNGQRLPGTNRPLSLRSAFPAALGSNNLFWHILFFAAYLLFLNRGGLTVFDIWLHSLFLVAAALVLALGGKTLRVKRGYLILMASILIFATLPLLPLPEGLFPYLAPIKARIVSQTTSIFPAIAHSREISMVPSFHRFKLAMLALDFLLILLGLMAPRPKPWVFRFWIALLAITLALLAILNGSGMLPDQGWLSRYRGTHGGLVNANHFGTMMAVLLVFLLSFLVGSCREVWRGWRRTGNARARLVTREYSWALWWLLCLVVTLLGFQFGWSRAGVLNLAAGALLFCLLSVSQTIRFRIRRLSWLAYLVVAAGLLLLILFIPMGRNLKKFQKGFDPNGRIELLMVGLEYLREGQILGTGLGSIESILDPVAPKLPTMTVNARELHNDYLQVLVELGYPGAICLFLGIGLLVRDLYRRLARTALPSRLFLNATLTMMFALALHSLVSFPLRINAIRVFAYLAILLGLKVTLKRPDPAATFRVPPWVPILLGLVLATLWTSTYMESRALATGEDARVVFAARYGRFYRADFYRANHNITRLFKYPTRIEDPDAVIQKTRALLYAHLKKEPFSLKALNLLFLLEAAEFRAYHPRFERVEFQALKTKAEAIRGLGRDRNIHSRLGFFFLLALYEPYLNEGERAEFQSLKEPLRYWMARIEQER